MSGDKFNKIKAGKGRKRCTTSVDDRRTKTLCFRDKRISWTSIGSDVSDARVSVSSKRMRSRLADVRPKGRIPRRKPHLSLQQR
ncbi:transposable element Tcb1 transposase [Trichonephila clavipes]|nr:transposable element Tcb1 transposase [Trichonephila clavipes]